MSRQGDLKLCLEILMQIKRNVWKSMVSTFVRTLENKPLQLSQKKCNTNVWRNLVEGNHSTVEPEVFSGH